MHHVIIGEGAAGLTAARRIRQLDPRADITIVADDPNPAYFRAALTNYLLGELSEQHIFAVPADFYARTGIRRLHARVDAIDPAARTVRLHDGSALPWDRLLIATGAAAKPLRLPNAGTVPGVWTLRTLRDARGMLDLLQSGQVRRAVVVGGGTLGLEWAQSLRRYQVDIVHVFRGDTVLSDLIDRRASDLILARARAAGVQLRPKEEIAVIEPGRDGRVAAVQLQRSGERLPCDLLAVAIGTEPGLACVAGSPLAIASGGLRVDAAMQTSVPDIYAAGDVAAVLDPRSGQAVRYGLWEPAQRQGAVAATNMVGGHSNGSHRTDEHSRFIVGTTYHATRLWDLDLVAVGRTTPAQGDTERVAPPAGPGRMDYRKVVLHGGRLVGAQLLGERGVQVRQRGRALHRLVDAGIDVGDVAALMFDEAFPLDAWAAVAVAAGPGAAVGASVPGSSAFVPPSVRLGMAPAAAPSRAVPSSAILRRSVDLAASAAPFVAPPGTGELWLVAADGRRQHLQSGLTIGRAPDRAWRIDDASVSGQHAMIHHGADGVEITDEGSTNGTWVNGVRIRAPHRLTPGDIVVLGSTRWSVAAASSRPAAPAPPAAPADIAEPFLEVTGRRVRLDASVTKLGRDPALAVVLDDAKVSRVHAQIERTADGDYIRDLDSMNRTWINDHAEPLSIPYRLQDGDVIRLGTTTRLVYHAGRRPAVGGR